MVPLSTLVRSGKCQSEDHARANELQHPGTLPVNVNEGTTCAKLREGAELRVVVGRTRKQRAIPSACAIKLTQTLKGTEMNQAEAPT